MKIIIINGPNLNLTGKRQKNIYGNVPFEDYLKKLRKDFPEMNIEYCQSNSEGDIIRKIQEADGLYDGILLNAGAYTHTSLAIADAIAAIDIPVVEVHISHIFQREAFRSNSVIAPYCKGMISGFGMESYRLGVAFFNEASSSA